VALWVAYQSLDRVNDLQDLSQERNNTLERIIYHEQKKKGKTVDPCAYVGGRGVDASVVHYIKLRYHLPDPFCRRALVAARRGRSS
jgi:hypothetical protein